MKNEEHVNVVLESGGRSVREEMAVAIYIDRYGTRIGEQLFEYVRDSGTVPDPRISRRRTVDGTCDVN